MNKITSICIRSKNGVSERREAGPDEQYECSLEGKAFIIKINGELACIRNIDSVDEIRVNRENQHENISGVVSSASHLCVDSGLSRIGDPGLYCSPYSASPQSFCTGDPVGRSY